MNQISSLRIAHPVVFVATLVAMFLLIVGIATAHTVTEVGDYAIIAAWENEPVVVGERNTIIIDIMRNNKTINSAEARLSFEMEAAEKRKPVAASPLTTDATLRYTITFIPTLPGRYDIHLSGLIGEDKLEVTVAPEEVLLADVIQFPEVSLSNGDLQDGLITIEERLAAAESQGRIALIAGGTGVLIGAVAIFLGRRKSAES